MNSFLMISMNLPRWPGGVRVLRSSCVSPTGPS
nr:MAG TPA: hypothetical protein [Caudoviricetes sp.]